ncbi:MAG: flagellar hook-length control protein FliK, partial [Nevskia sp.]|nr:flagellar hook-length control protein FliK [Nevskia sp.]
TQSQPAAGAAPGPAAKGRPTGGSHPPAADDTPPPWMQNVLNLVNAAAVAVAELPATAVTIGADATAAADTPAAPAQDASKSKGGKPAGSDSAVDAAPMTLPAAANDAMQMFAVPQVAAGSPVAGVAGPGGAAKTGVTGAVTGDSTSAARSVLSAPELRAAAIAAQNPSSPAVPAAPPQADAAVLQQSMRTTEAAPATDPQSSLAAPAAMPRSSLPLDQSAWAGALHDHVQWQLGQGVQEARLELHPRELGSIQVHVRVDGSGADVQFAAAHPQARQALSASLPQLRQMLAGDGLQLGQAQVGAQSQPFRQPRAAAASGATADDGADEGDALVATVPRVIRIGLVDDYA